MALDPTAPNPPPPPPTPVRTFLRTWRREIIRGSVLFGIVVFIGLAVSRVRVGIPGSLPGALEQLRQLQEFDIDPDGPLFGAGREVGDPWQWRGPLQAGQSLWIRNTNGPVDIEPTSGTMLEVHAEKSWHRSSPDAVELVQVPSEHGVTICAVWRARETRCGDRGDYEQRDVRHNDVAVRFAVKLPRGVKVDVSTVNGHVIIRGATAAIEVETVNGRIALMGGSGPTKAETVNGSIEAHLDALTGFDVELETVNGSVTALVPPGLNAVVDASTIHGRVTTNLPGQVSGRITPREVHGTLGKGGLSLKLGTVNGSITIGDVTAKLTPHPDGDAPQEPSPPAAPAAPRIKARPSRP